MSGYAAVNEAFRYARKQNAMLREIVQERAAATKVTVGKDSAPASQQANQKSGAKAVVKPR